MVMDPQEVQRHLVDRLPGAEVTVQDLTGTSDHFHVIVMWSQFLGKDLIQQHQIVNQALKEPLDDGRIHALQIKTVTAPGA